MTNQKQSLSAADAAATAPAGFTFSASNEHFVNDVELYDGPERYSDDLRINITSSWCPADGVQLWIDSPPPEALTVEQATWLATALPKVLAEINGVEP